MTKDEAIQKLKSVHDILKSHPYRYNFQEKYAKSYWKLLSDLSDAWGDLIYRADLTNDEEVLFRKYGAWIHNYNASLFKDVTYLRKWMPYYESVLSVTHRYIETGDMSSFYKLDYRTHNGVNYIVPQRYYLVTAESCGIDSPELPRYFPYGEHLSENEDAIRAYLQKYYRSNPEKVELLVDDWRINLLPIIQWHNNSIPADHVSTRFDTIMWWSL